VHTGSHRFVNQEPSGALQWADDLPAIGRQRQVGCSLFISIVLVYVLVVRKFFRSRNTSFFVVESPDFSQ
jgi:hypothetical protein